MGMFSRMGHLPLIICVLAVVSSKCNIISELLMSVLGVSGCQKASTSGTFKTSGFLLGSMTAHAEPLRHHDSTHVYDLLNRSTSVPHVSPNPSLLQKFEGTIRPPLEIGTFETSFRDLEEGDTITDTCNDSNCRLPSGHEGTRGNNPGGPISPIFAWVYVILVSISYCMLLFKVMELFSTLFRALVSIIFSSLFFVNANDWIVVNVAALLIALGTCILLFVLRVLIYKYRSSGNKALKAAAFEVFVARWFPIWRTWMTSTLLTFFLSSDIKEQQGFANIFILSSSVSVKGARFFSLVCAGITIFLVIIGMFRTELTENNPGSLNYVCHGMRSPHFPTRPVREHLFQESLHLEFVLVRTPAYCVLIDSICAVLFSSLSLLNDPVVKASLGCIFSSLALCVHWFLLKLEKKEDRREERPPGKLCLIVDQVRWMKAAAAVSAFSSLLVVEDDVVGPVTLLALVPTCGCGFGCYVLWHEHAPVGVAHSDQHATAEIDRDMDNVDADVDRDEDDENIIRSDEGPEGGERERVEGEGSTLDDVDDGRCEDDTSVKDSGASSDDGPEVVGEGEKVESKDSTAGRDTDEEHREEDESAADWKVVGKDGKPRASSPSSPQRTFNDGSGGGSVSKTEEVESSSFFKGVQPTSSRTPLKASLPPSSFHPQSVDFAKLLDEIAKHKIPLPPSSEKKVRMPPRQYRRKSRKTGRKSIYVSPSRDSGPIAPSKGWDSTPEKRPGLTVNPLFPPLGVIKEDEVGCDTSSDITYQSRTNRKGTKTSFKDLEHAASEASDRSSSRLSHSTDGDSNRSSLAILTPLRRTPSSAMSDASSITSSPLRRSRTDESGPPSTPFSVLSPGGGAIAASPTSHRGARPRRSSVAPDKTTSAPEEALESTGLRRHRSLSVSREMKRRSLERTNVKL